MDISHNASPTSNKTGCYSSGSTPFSSRRTSFLSQTMIDSESFSVYDTYSFSREAPAHHIISLKESQGFRFNQDLFASAYQQSRTLMRERQWRESKSKKRSKSHSGASRWKSPSIQKQRRHTTFDSGPSLRIVGDDMAVAEDSSDEMCIDECSETSISRGAPPPTLAKAMSFSAERDGSILETHNRNEDTDIDIEEESEEEKSEEEGESDGSEDHESSHYKAIGANYVPVIEISVDDMDHIPDL